MRTIITQLIIVSIVLSFALLPSAQDENYTSAQLWSKLDDNFKMGWIQGLRYGVSYTTNVFIDDLDLFNKDMSDELVIVREKTEINWDINTKVTSDVMTKYYDDPANSLIDFVSIYYAAQSKLMGNSENDVNRLLEIGRKKALSED